MNTNDRSDSRSAPVHEIRLARIRATVWANRGHQRELWYSVAVSRRYCDGDVWKDASTFGRDDLPLVVKAAEMAYAWIWQQQTDKQERGNHER